MCRPRGGAGWQGVEWSAWNRSRFREPLAGSCMSVTFSRGEMRTYKELCLFLPLPLPQVVFALNQTLLQQESLRAGSFQIPYTTEDLIKHYNCGDLSSIIFNHDTSQVSLATAALVLRTCPRSANPSHSHLSLLRRAICRQGPRACCCLPGASTFLHLLSQESAPPHPLSCCTQAAKEHLAFPFG